MESGDPSLGGQIPVLGAVTGNFGIWDFNISTVARKKGMSTFFLVLFFSDCHVKSTRGESSSFGFSSPEV